jgi:T5SS/PEP-CTERM-associated repeat protein
MLPALLIRFVDVVREWSRTMALRNRAGTFRVAVLFIVAWGACVPALADIINSGSVSPAIDEVGDVSADIVQVGISGPGSLQVSGGSILSSTSGWLGPQANGSGTVGVSNRGEWNVAGVLVLGFVPTASGALSVVDATVSADYIAVGAEGMGTVNLDDVARLNTESAVLGNIGTTGFDLGTATLTDDSQWTNSGAMVIGGGAQASMTVASGSTVQTATLEIGQSTTATLNIQAARLRPQPRFPPADYRYWERIREAKARSW